MIRLLADENVPRASVRRLRVSGFDVAEIAPGSDDGEVLARAAAEGRVVVTLDRDLGWLVLRGSAPIPPGVLYLRLRVQRPEAPADALLPALRRLGDGVLGYLTVVEAHGTRRRRIPRRG